MILRLCNYAHIRLLWHQYLSNSLTRFSRNNMTIRDYKHCYIEMWILFWSPNSYRRLLNLCSHSSLLSCACDTRIDLPVNKNPMGQPMPVTLNRLTAATTWHQTAWTITTWHVQCVAILLPNAVGVYSMIALMSCFGRVGPGWALPNFTALGVWESGCTAACNT